jgi:hypothetical protein
MTRRRSTLAPAVFVGAAVIALSACGADAAPVATVTQVAPTVTVAPSVSATPTPSPPVEPATTETQAAPAAPETFTMPKLVGENLQLAQDTLQKVGSYILDQEDALGLDRIQVMDSNWQVCSQTPKAGTKVPVETVVLLASVKLTESCP